MTNYRVKGHPVYELYGEGDIDFGVPDDISKNLRAYIRFVVRRYHDTNKYRKNDPLARRSDDYDWEPYLYDVLTKFDKERLMALMALKNPEETEENNYHDLWHLINDEEKDYISYYVRKRDGEDYDDEDDEDYDDE